MLSAIQFSHHLIEAVVACSSHNFLPCWYSTHTITDLLFVFKYIFTLKYTRKGNYIMILNVKPCREDDLKINAMETKNIICINYY